MKRRPNKQRTIHSYEKELEALHRQRTQLVKSLKALDASQKQESNGRSGDWLPAFLFPKKKDRPQTLYLPLRKAITADIVDLNRRMRNTWQTITTLEQGRKHAA